MSANPGPSSSAAMVRPSGTHLDVSGAHAFVEVSERRRRGVDIIGLGGALLGSMMFAAPLAGISIPSAVAVGWTIGCLTVFFGGRRALFVVDQHRLKEFGLADAEAGPVLRRYLTARALIPQGAKRSARRARLARAILDAATTTTSERPK